jgi:hypothetical protein
MLTSPGRPDEHDIAGVVKKPQRGQLNVASKYLLSASAA